jgi:pyruvate/2-oxoglutarate dehydrogenase complex dihydrolipoamide acyltransferase (E2) component
MIYALVIPEVIEDVEEVRVLKWHGDTGHSFAPGELIVELETHKALVEVRAGQPGVLRSVLSQEGDWLSVGQPMAMMGDTPNEPLPQAAEGLASLAVRFEIS